MPERRPVAVLVTPVAPHPGGSGGALRAWDWLQSLGQEHRVHVVVADAHAVAAPSSAAGPATAVAAEAIWPLGQTLRWGAPGLTRMGLLCPVLTLRSTRFAVDWRHLDPGPGPLDDCFAAIGDGPVRRIVVFRLRLHEVGCAVSHRFPTAVVELDMDDCEPRTRLSVGVALLRLGRYGAAWRSVSGAIQYRLLERLAAHYQTVYLAAAEDCPRVSVGPQTAVVHWPNRVTLPACVAPAPSGGELRLLFVGGLGYPPNEEAVRWLAAEVLPVLRRRLTRPWRLGVVGRQAPQALQALLARTVGIEWAPDVDDLSDWYAGAHVVLVPLRSGGGTKLKTLEAFAHCRPVISTRHGVRGLGAVAGEHYLLAERAHEFAAAIVRLAADPALAQRLAAAGRCLCAATARPSGQSG